jgi:branched-chain amino acid transport system substrate-binding protein
MATKEGSGKIDHLVTSRVSRRRFLKNAAAAGVGIGSLAAGSSLLPKASAANNPVKLLGLLPMSGAYAADGELLQRGQRMAIDEWDGTIIGRPLEYLVRDGETDPGVSMRRVADAVEREDVKIVIGAWADNVANAVNEVCKNNKRIYYWSGGPVEMHKHLFLWSPSYWTAVKADIDYVMKKNPNLKRWYMLSPDYAFGSTLETLEQSIGKEFHGLEFVGSAKHVAGEREFSRYMADIAATKPDGIFINSWGLDFAAAMRELASFGLNKKMQIIMPWGSGVDDYLRLTPEITEGVVIGTSFYHTVDNPVAKDLTARFKEKYGAPPGYPSGSIYDQTRIMLKAVERAGTDDPDAMVAALEGWEFDGLLGSCRIDPETHRTSRPFFVTEGKPSNEITDPFDPATVVSESVETPPAEWQ